MLHLSKNLKYLRENHDKMSQGKLAEIIGSTRSAISSYEDGRAEPKLDTLNKLADFFKVSVDRLINDNLPQLGLLEEKIEQSKEEYFSGKHLRILTTTLDKEGKENVEMVPEKAAAGYTTGFADPEYLSRLPKFHLPILSKDKSYRAFEINGDSMLPLVSGSIVIGEYVEDWTSLKSGEIYVVVGKDGIVLKQVFNKLKESGKLLLKSSNLAYAPYEIEGESVLEVWKFAAFISRKFPEEYSSIHELKSAFLRLEDDVREMKKSAK